MTELYESTERFEELYTEKTDQIQNQCNVDDLCMVDGEEAKLERRALVAVTVLKDAAMKVKSWTYSLRNNKIERMMGLR